MEELLDFFDSTRGILKNDVLEDVDQTLAVSLMSLDRRPVAFLNKLPTADVPEFLELIEAGRST